MASFCDEEGVGFQAVGHLLSELTLLVSEEEFIGSTCHIYQLKNQL
jgi:hypothetical protein